MGTATYMSPEQAWGAATLTAQRDQFSFGSVRLAAAPDKMTAILGEEAETLPATVPRASLRWTNRAAAVKEPAARYDSTRDAGIYTASSPMA